ncbi:hypothetical protein MTP99_007180 [Tenebrio molitor]|nr:hypothetical protein MTP99_007180 [Tenebrio molitor]
MVNNYVGYYRITRQQKSRWLEDYRERFRKESTGLRCALPTSSSERLTRFINSFHDPHQRRKLDQLNGRRDDDTAGEQFPSS